MKNNVFKVALIGIFVFVIINNFIYFPGNILSWDVFGYYLYLPFKFIYHNLGLNPDSEVFSIIEKYKNTTTFYQALKMPDGNYVMKYSMGLSIFYAPFFFIGHLAAGVFNYPTDGFSLPYQYSIFIGGIIYSMIGIWALSKVLLHYFSKNIVIITLLIIVFGTNYLVHITMFGQNAMSQNYLFTTYALILWLSILWYDSFKLKYAVMLGILCGITILSRPSEVVCLIIPALWGIWNVSSMDERIKLLYKHKFQILTFAAILVVFGLFQLVYWKIFTGKFIYYSYGGNAGEGFEFFRPYVLQVLFSFRKGWLIYTPVMIFGIIGFYFIYKNNRSVFYALFLYFIANIYIVSSWSCWWYAQSFSQRALIPSYPVMAIAMGYFLVWLFQQNKLLKGIIYVLLGGLILLNLFQTQQFSKGIIDGDRMTMDYYFRVFGKSYATAEDKKFLLVNRSFSGVDTFENEGDYSFKILKKLDFEGSEKGDTTVFYSGKSSFRLDSATIYSPAIEAPYYDITDKDYAWVKVTAYVYPTRDVMKDPFSLVVNFVHKGWSYKYSAFDSDKMKLELNKWNKITFNYLTPEVRRKTDNLKVYFWNRGKAKVFVDDLEVDIYEKK